MTESALNTWKKQSNAPKGGKHINDAVWEKLQEYEQDYIRYSSKKILVDSVIIIAINHTLNYMKKYDKVKFNFRH